MPFIVSSGTGVVCDSLSGSVVAVDSGRTGQFTGCSVWPRRPGASVVAVGSAVAAMSGPTTLGGAVVVCICESRARACVCVCVKGLDWW